MTRGPLRAQLASLDLSKRPDETGIRDRMLALLDGDGDCFERTSFPAHFTGSAFVVDANGGRALLHHHRKLGRWLQFGGHCDGDADIVAVARREALEESGIPGLIVASERPFDLDIHEIPAHGGDPAHFHYDVRFMLIAPEAAAPILSEESHGLRWFSPAELAEADLDAGIRRMVRKWQSIVARRAH